MSLYTLINGMSFYSSSQVIVDLVIFNSHIGLEQFCNRILGAKTKKMVILGKQLQILF